MSQIVWTKTAIDDVDRLVESLNEINPDAATRAAESIRRAGMSLNENSKRGAMVQGVPGVRKLIVPFGRYGFVLHYAILEDKVLILRIYHARQNRPL